MSERLMTNDWGWGECWTFVDCQLNFMNCARAKVSRVYDCMIYTISRGYIYCGMGVFLGLSC